MKRLDVVAGPPSPSGEEDQLLHPNSCEGNFSESMTSKDDFPMKNHLDNGMQWKNFLTRCKSPCEASCFCCCFLTIKPRVYG
jgi:hypothetical protein